MEKNLGVFQWGTKTDKIVILEQLI
ncbi:uncharacterized protein METZ01_LOCUS276003 [marine metagenome]|uniref:Uncharacterized protein n=1 Tax=marine metagenome TaxID=408172 RepID=A0A382KG03_9ZZZZ